MVRSILAMGAGVFLALASCAYGGRVSVVCGSDTECERQEDARAEVARIYARLGIQEAR